MKHPSPSLATVPWVAALGDLVRERLGYEIPEHRLTREVAPRVVAHAEAHGHRSPQDFVTSLQAAPSGEEWKVLVQVVTVGETFFFRHPQQLQALAGSLRAGSEGLERPLRIWSAGCATGEEPYSVAMLLDEMGVPFALLGTDVDATALDKAHAATNFSDRSVSHLPQHLRKRWLESTRPGRWRLRNPERLRVRFESHNLVHDAPLHPEPGAGWDAILCRNVLLYFTPETGTGVVGRLGRCLEPEGGLWVGPCDHVEIGSEAAGLGWRSAGGERYLGRGGRAPLVAPPRPALEPARGEAPQTTPWRLIERGLHATARRAVEEQLEGAPDDGEHLLLLGAFHLREHAFEEALATFDRAAAAHPIPPGVAYLQGVTHLKAGRDEEAAAAFGDALEQDPDDWASSCQLALLYRRSGRSLREEVMLLRTLDRLGEDAPCPTDLGAAARLVNSVHSDPGLTRREVQRRLAELDGGERRNGRPS